MMNPLFLFVVIEAAAGLSAQTPTARITGRILDPGGAEVPAAKVTSINLQTGVETRTVTTSGGVYELPNLIPGSYNLTVETKGFRRLERGPMELRVGATLALDLQLELGSVTETVSVHAEAPLLEPANASLGQVIDRRQINDLPIPNDNLQYLMLLIPGVVVAQAPTAEWSPVDVVGNSISAGPGARAWSNTFTIDGAPNTTAYGNGRNRVFLAVNTLPPREMIQEFDVRTALYDASIGHFAGASVNLASISGTNRLHGSGFFSHTSRPLVTRAYFVNSTPGREWPYSKRNKYRATFNGPVRVPKLYDGKNRTFFSYGFEFAQRISPESQLVTVPASAHREGNFSDLLSLGSAYQIYDPATTASSGAIFQRQPFAGNRIPPSRLDPVARNLLSYYPLPNTSAVRGQLNYNASGIGTLESTLHTIRLDHAIGAGHRMFASWMRSASNDQDADVLGTGATGQSIKRKSHTVSLNDSITIRPNLIAELRYSLFRSYSPVRSNNSGADLRAIGFPASLVNRLDPELVSLPRITMNGYQTIGSQQATVGQLLPWTLAYTNHLAAGNLYCVRGSHTVRAGGEFRGDLQNFYNYGNIAPTFNFTGQWTNGPLSTTAAAPVGHSLAGFLLGLPNSGQLQVVSPTSVLSKFIAGYLQDDWKITRRLTLNAGIRYELEMPETERYNRMNRPFDDGAPSPIEAAARRAYAANPIPDVPVDAFQVKGGFRFAGVDGEPRTIYDTDKNNLMPRIGLAFQATPKTVIRSGYGVYFTLIGMVSPLQQGFASTTPVDVSPDNGLSFRASLSNPFPNGFIEPAGATAGLRTMLGQQTEVLARRKNGYMQRWSFSIQRELPGRFLVEAGYIGNKGIGEQGAEQYNGVPNRFLSKSPIRDQATINYLSATVANPFFGLPEFAGTTLQNRTVARRQLLRPFPQFVGLSGVSGTSIAWYHAGYASFTRRFARGFMLQGSYTWSKLMEAVSKLNQGDAGFEHRISGEDYPHKLVFSGAWELPFQPRPAWVRKIAVGWSLQGIYQYQIRQPLSFDTVNPLFLGDFTAIHLPASQRTVDRWFNTDGFERNASRQLADNLRSFPSRLAGVRAPSWNNLDLSLFKTFRLRERLSFQLRAEAQDSLNHPVFNVPNTTPTAANFGRITSTPTDDQRRITLSGKLIW